MGRRAPPPLPLSRFAPARAYPRGLRTHPGGTPQGRATASASARSLYAPRIPHPPQKSQVIPAHNTVCHRAPIVLYGYQTAARAVDVGGEDCHSAPIASTIEPRKSFSPARRPLTLLLPRGAIRAPPGKSRYFASVSQPPASAGAPLSRSSRAGGRLRSFGSSAISLERKTALRQRSLLRYATQSLASAPISHHLKLSLINRTD